MWSSSTRGESVRQVWACGFTHAEKLKDLNWAYDSESRPRQLTVFECSMSHLLCVKSMADCSTNLGAMIAKGGKVIIQGYHNARRLQLWFVYTSEDFTDIIFI